MEPNGVHLSRHLKGFVVRSVLASSLILSPLTFDGKLMVVAPSSHQEMLYDFTYGGGYPSDNGPSVHYGFDSKTAIVQNEMAKDLFAAMGTRVYIPDTWNRPFLSYQHIEVGFKRAKESYINAHVFKAGEDKDSPWEYHWFNKQRPRSETEKFNWAPEQAPGQARNCLNEHGVGFTVYCAKEGDTIASVVENIGWNWDTSVEFVQDKSLEYKTISCPPGCPKRRISKLKLKDNTLLMLAPCVSPELRQYHVSSIIGFGILRSVELREVLHSPPALSNMLDDLQFKHLYMFEFKYSFYGRESSEHRFWLTFGDAVKRFDPKVEFLLKAKPTLVCHDEWFKQGDWISTFGKETHWAVKNFKQFEIRGKARGE